MTAFQLGAFQGGAFQSSQTLAPALFTNAQTFFAPAVKASYALKPGLLTNAQTFYGPTAVRGAVTLATDLLANQQTFYAPTASATYTLAPGLLANTQAFYAPSIRETARLLPSLLTNVQAFFAPAVTTTSKITPSLLVNAQKFFTLDVTKSLYTVTREQARLLYQIYLLHGLADPLVVGPSSRAAGAIRQTVSEAGGTVTVKTLEVPVGLPDMAGLMIEELAALHGLGADLEVTSISRRAGAVTQSMQTSGGATRVVRA